MWKRRGSSRCRCRRTSTGPRCATTSSAGAVSGRTWSGARIRANSRSFPPRATTSRRRCASPARRTAPCATSWKSTPRRNTNPARAWRTGAICPPPMNSSGIRSAAIGGTSTSTTWPPASSRTRSRQATSWLRSCCAWMRRRDALLSGRRAGEGARPLFRSPVSCGLRWQRAHTADARGCQPRSDLLALGPLFCGQLLEARCAARERIARRRREVAGDARKGGHLQAAGGGMEASGGNRGEGARRRDRSLRPAIQAHQPRPGKKYPIVNYIYPGPQSGSVGVFGRSFAAARGDAQALAELGFIVAMIDGMGNPQPSKSFHDAYYGNMGDNTLPDQVGGMQQLARRSPWIDIERAGIWGHSGGGYAAADAMFRYPDFFKVGISEAGNHDNREYEDDWGERYQGLLRKSGDGTNYDDQANQNFAKNLKGHLLLAHGTMDTNVPPYNTLLVVNELIKANKDFDLLLLPNRHHGFGSEPYMVRRRWDYFVRYLMGAEPPKEYELKAPANGMGGAPEGRKSGAGLLARLVGWDGSPNPRSTCSVSESSKIRVHRRSSAANNNLRPGNLWVGRIPVARQVLDRDGVPQRGATVIVLYFPF